MEADGAVAVTGEASSYGAAAGVAGADAGALAARGQRVRGAGGGASADGDGADGGGGGGGSGAGGDPRAAVAAKISAARRLARKLSEEKVTRRRGRARV